LNKGIKSLQAEPTGLSPEYLKRIQIANEGRYHELGVKGKIKVGRNSEQKGSFYYGSPERKQYHKARTEVVSEKIMNPSHSSNGGSNAAPSWQHPPLKSGSNANSTLVHKQSSKSTAGGKTTAKKKTTFNYKEGGINNSNIKAHNKFFTASKFGYDENILDSNSKAVIAPVPFNLESGLSGIPDASSTGSDGA
jgi:hypothetical protein